MHDSEEHRREHAPSAPAATLPRDPVCGMSVSQDTPHRYLHNGTEFLFCCAHCRERFIKDPGAFLTSQKPKEQLVGITLGPLPPVKPPSAGEWTCPMHPEVVRNAPGSCPICGMALEPRYPGAAHEEENPELKDMTRRFWFAAALTLPLVLIAMGDMLPVLSKIPMQTRGLLELALATPVCLWSAWPFYERAVLSITNRSLNMFTLIGLGVSVAYLFSVVAVIFPGVFPESFRHDSGGVGVYFEAAAAIVTLVLLG